MKKVNYLVIAMLLFVFACSTSSSIIGNWKDESYVGPKEFKKIAVIALSRNESSKLSVEKTFVDRLTYMGYDAMYGSKILVPSIVKEENKEMIEKMMEDNGVDGVLMLSLLDVKQGTRYVPGSGSYSPGGYYGGYYGYYSYSYNHYYGGTPGYYETTESIYLEANFYDLNKEGKKLVSSVQTETVDPSGIDDVADSFSYTILRNLLDKKILENKSGKK